MSGRLWVDVVIFVVDVADMVVVVYSFVLLLLLLMILLILLLLMFFLGDCSDKDKER